MDDMIFNKKDGWQKKMPTPHNGPPYKIGEDEEQLWQRSLIYHALLDHMPNHRWIWSLRHPIPYRIITHCSCNRGEIGLTGWANHVAAVAHSALMSSQDCVNLGHHD